MSTTTARELWKIYNLTTNTITIDNVGVIKSGDYTETESIDIREKLGQDPYVLELLQADSIRVDKYLDGSLATTVTSANASTALLIGSGGSGSSSLSDITIDDGSTNGPNQLVQLNEDGELVGSIINRTATTASSLTEVIPMGQFLFRTDDDLNTVVRGDGVTAGGLLACSDAAYAYADSATFSSSLTVSNYSPILTIPNVKAGEIWSLELHALNIFADAADPGKFDFKLIPASAYSYNSAITSTVSDGVTTYMTFVINNGQWDTAGATQSIITYYSLPAPASGWVSHTKGILKINYNCNLIFTAFFDAVPVGDVSSSYAVCLKRIK